MNEAPEFSLFPTQIKARMYVCKSAGDGKDREGPEVKTMDVDSMEGASAQAKAHSPSTSPTTALQEASGKSEAATMEAEAAPRPPESPSQTEYVLLCSRNRFDHLA